MDIPGEIEEAVVMVLLKFGKKFPAKQTAGSMYGS